MLSNVYKSNLGAHLRVKKLLVVCFFSASADALELKADVYSETEYTSNARLETVNTKDETIQSVGVNLLLNEERKRFNATASFNISKEFYLKNTFDDETRITTCFGLFNFDIVEGFLDWRTSFNRTEVLTDSVLADTPDNRENRNVFRTGPSVNYRVNPVSTIKLGANFVQIENSAEVASDTKRVGANASYIYNYNSLTNISLNSSYDGIIEAEQNGVSLDDDKTQNTTLNLGVNRRFSHGSFSLNIGQNSVRTDNQETLKGAFFNLMFQREQVLAHDLNLTYRESFSDSSIGFSGDDELENNNDVAELEVANQLDIIKRKRLGLVLDRTIDTFNYSLNVYLTNLDYELQNNDEESIGVTLSLKQRIRDGWTTGLVITNVKQKFNDRPEEGTRLTQTYTIDSDYQLTKRLSFNGQIGYSRRSNSEQPIREYEDVSVKAKVNWTFY